MNAPYCETGNGSIVRYRGPMCSIGVIGIMHRPCYVSIVWQCTLRFRAVCR